MGTLIYVTLLFIIYANINGAKYGGLSFGHRMRIGTRLPETYIYVVLTVLIISGMFTLIKKVMIH